MTIAEDIQQSREWIIQCFKAEGWTLDYSMDSLKRIDQFLDDNIVDGQAKTGSILARNRGQILFAIGCYVGETIRTNIAGAIWDIDEADEERGVNAAIVLPNGVTLWPVQKVVKRYFNGEDDSIYPYVVIAVKELCKDGYWETAQGTAYAPATPSVKLQKPWWKFW
jgi:hypothetical protein